MKFSELRPDTQVTLNLSEKYQVNPLVIAYIRAALLQQEHPMTKQSLLFHITETNIERKKEIQKLQFTITEYNIETVKAQIFDIQKRIDLRQGVLNLIRLADDRMIKDLCQPES